MDIKVNKPYKLDIDETLKQLNSSTQGISYSEVEKRLTKYGYNIITSKSNFKILKLIAKQVKSPLVYILFVAALISYVADHMADTVVISGVILINAVIGFVQEYRAERSMESLKNLLTLKAKVIREGELVEVDSKELVLGDIIIIEEGDKVPADARIIESQNLRLLESPITGESIPTEKDNTKITQTISIGDRKNMLWMSSVAVSGKSRAIVTATGNNTVVGQIASSIENIKKEKSHFDQITSLLSKQMAFVAVVGAIVIFAVGYLVRNISFEEIFLFSIASLVSSIPEGLPAVLTLVLAIGAYRVSKKNAIIRNLHASETLGIINTIATDKTGTLTQNKMTVTDIWIPEDQYISVTGSGWSNIGKFLVGTKEIDPLKNINLELIVKAGFQSNSSKLFRNENDDVSIIGDPTEASLLVLGEKAGLEYSLKENVIFDLPFNSEEKLRASIIKEDSNKIIAIGAAEKILEISDEILTNSENIKINNVHKDIVLNSMKFLGGKGLRVLGIGYKNVDSSQNEITHEDFSNFTFVGLVGMKDPVRLEAKNAVAKTKDAGIRVIMLTGDHKETALAIAKELELDENYIAYSEDELQKLSEEEFRKAVMNVNIFCRLSPDMKLKIASVLQANGGIIAMTGDGVNDAPALKQADVGIAMGKIGTDSARESSEIILADDNFSSIVSAIEEGRVIFFNIRRAASFLITTNVAEQLTILVSLFLGFPLPLLASQILWLNLVTDGVNDFALATEKSHGRTLNQKPRNKNEGVLNKETLLFIIIMSICMLVITLFFYTRYLDEGIEKARTVAFLCMSFTQLFNAINFRSFKQSIFKIGLFSNKFVNIAFISSFLLTLTAVYLDPIQNLLKFVLLEVELVLVIFIISSTPLLIGELIKLIRFNR